MLTLHVADVPRRGAQYATTHKRPLVHRLPPPFPGQPRHAKTYTWKKATVSRTPILFKKTLRNDPGLQIHETLANLSYQGLTYMHPDQAAHDHPKTGKFDPLKKLVGLIENCFGFGSFWRRSYPRADLGGHPGHHVHQDQYSFEQ